MPRPVALEILHRAGLELARLAKALRGRVGPRPVALAGRAASLHPAILSAMAGALPDGPGAPSACATFSRHGGTSGGSG
jgi:hypothetical protein